MAISAGIDEANLNLVDTLEEVNNSYLRLSFNELKEFYTKIVPDCIEVCNKYGVRLKVSPMFTTIVNYISSSDMPASTRHNKLYKSLTGINSDDFSILYRNELYNFENGLYGREFYSMNKCYIPLNNAYIMANGDLYPCLRAIGYNEIRPFGNIYHQSIDVIRSSPEWNNYSKNAGKHNVCNTCKNFFEHNLKIRN